MEKLKPEKISGVEITKKDVLDSLIKNPEEYSVYSKWRKSREGLVRLDTSPWAMQGFELEAMKIVVKAAKASGNRALFENALDMINDCIDQAEFSKDEVLARSLYPEYKELLKEYNEKFSD